MESNICRGANNDITNPYNRECGPIYSRGLCNACYQLARTWEVLEEVALPKRGAKGRRPESAKHCKTCTCNAA